MGLELCSLLLPLMQEGKLPAFREEDMMQLQPQVTDGCRKNTESLTDLVATHAN